jgi:hypothetical protein
MLHYHNANFHILACFYFVHDDAQTTASKVVLNGVSRNQQQQQQQWQSFI